MVANWLVVSWGLPVYGNLYLFIKLTCCPYCQRQEMVYIVSPFRSSLQFRTVVDKMSRQSGWNWTKRWPLWVWGIVITSTRVRAKVGADIGKDEREGILMNKRQWMTWSIMAWLKQRWILRIEKYGEVKLTGMMGTSCPLLLFIFLPLTLVNISCWVFFLFWIT